MAIKYGLKYHFLTPYPKNADFRAFLSPFSARGERLITNRVKKSKMPQYFAERVDTQKKRTALFNAVRPFKYGGDGGSRTLEIEKIYVDY